jgi:ribosomal RNA assembly protein
MHVKIPLNRIGVLVGSDGTVKREIEERFGVVIDINSQAGDVEVTMASNESDPSGLFRVRDIVLAIGRGFSSDNAFKLFDEEMNFGILDLRDYLGKSQADIQRIKGRIIGKNGKTRKIIEEYSEASISVYGHTVSIIGEMESFEIAKAAIELLIRGSLHKSVYKFLQWKRIDLKKKSIEIWKLSPSDMAKSNA